MTRSVHLPRRSALALGFSAGAGLVAAALVGRGAHAEGRPRLCVFAPADIPAHVLQKALSGALPSVDVTVFGRFPDFENGLASKPDAALTSRNVLQAKGLSISVTGTNAGSTSEPYALIAMGKEVEPNRVTSVGAVDLMGRQGMKELVARLLGTPARIERVTKLEDLLPLLQFGMVDAVLVPERLTEPFRARSKLDLRVTKARGGVGLPALSVLGPGGTPLIQSIKALSPTISQYLGVSKWE